MKRKIAKKKVATTSEPRDVAILVRVSVAEKAKLKGASRVDGLGVSTMLRSLGLERARKLSAS